MDWISKRAAPDRRCVLTGAAAALAAPAVLRAQTGSEQVMVETASGRLRGQRGGGVDVFKGVPYGDTVSGAGRFRPARPAPAWAGVRDALSLGTPSLQHSNTVYGLNEPAPGEDCLVLNIWAPADRAERRPVMFYSHGGGFTTGSGGSVTQDGANLAREYGVVVVSTNHRLGLLGYLYLEELGGTAYAGSGNQGLSDIVLGLKWTRRNIAAFGGDPDNIMIFGESGGGAKTSCLYAMPSAAPMFSKAAVQSGPAVRVGTPETAARTTRMVLDELGIAPGEWRRLLDVPGPAILDVQAALSKRTAGGAPGGWRGIADFRPGAYGPILQPDLLPTHPFDPAAPAAARDKPLIVGWNDSEAAFFALESKDFAAFSLDEAGLRARLARDLGAHADEVIAAYRSDRPTATPTDIYLAAQSARAMGEGSLLIAERKAAQGAAPVYYYNLAYRSNRKPPGVDRELGAMHAIDIPLVFDNAASTDTLAGSRSDRNGVASTMSAFWTSFAHTGRPAAPGRPAWNPYDRERRSTMVIDVECSPVDDRHAAERLLWERIDPAV
jgi:para-nitrobenzyl esterase